MTKKYSSKGQEIKLIKKTNRKVVFNLFLLRIEKTGHSINTVSPKAKNNFAIQ